MSFQRLSFHVWVLLLFMAKASFAAPACKDVFYWNSEVAALVSYDPVKQWLAWEQKANIEKFRKSELPVQIPALPVDAKTVDLTFFSGAPPELRSFLQLNSESVLWFKHPYNTNPKVPYSAVPARWTLSGFLTASRSLALNFGKYVYTLKTATNLPHGPEGELQNAKATTREDIMDGINRMSYIEKVDGEIGLDKNLILAKEVAMVADKESGEGYLFRDLSFMNDGNYYLPALSIPYAGRKIAELNKQAPEEFWKKNYAELLGEAKAKLLLRYGLQMETPNAQNMLIQLDRDLRPTGVIVFRDISDTVLIESVARGLGETEALHKDAMLGVENSNQLRPFWRNSAWRFDEAGEQSFSKETLAEWGKAHNSAYRKYIERTLQIDLSPFRILDRNQALDDFLGFDFVQAKLKAYRLRLKIYENLKQKKDLRKTS